MLENGASEQDETVSQCAWNNVPGVDIHKNEPSTFEMQVWTLF